MIRRGTPKRDLAKALIIHAVNSHGPIRCTELIRMLRKVGIGCTAEWDARRELNITPHKLYPKKSGGSPWIISRVPGVAPHPKTRRRDCLLCCEALLERAYEEPDLHLADQLIDEARLFRATT